MRKFIDTFYLWLGLFTVCNIISIFVVQIGQPFSLERWFLYPVAWLFQLPLVLLLASVFYGVSRCFSRFPDRLKKGIRFSLCLFCSFVIMGMYAASQLMYQQIDTFISWDAYRAGFTNAAQLIPDIRAEIGGQLAVAGLVAFLFSVLYTRRYHGQKPSHSPLLFALVCMIFLASGAGGVVYVYTSGNETAKRIRRDVLPTTFLTFDLIDNLLPSISPSMDFISGLVLEDQVSLEDYFSGHQLEERPDVYLIMLESVTWDRYGFTGYERSDVTPNMNDLAADSLIFTRAYAAANHSNYAQTSVHASQYPLRRKQLDQFETVNYPKTLLFDLLSHAGYRTAFFSAQNEDWQGMKSFIFSDTTLQHFFHSKDVLGDDIGAEAKINDEIVRRSAVDYLSTFGHEEPVFMYLNFQATHFPYKIPERAEQPYQPCSTDDFDFSYTAYDQIHLDRVINKYDNALRYIDTQVGAFIDHLKRTGRYDRSLIILASDHGEAFYEHGLPTHSTSLYDEQVRTAVLFKLPGSEKTGLREDVISLIDLNPTILETLGLPNHPNFQGQQVLTKPRDEPIYMLSHSLVKSYGLVDFPWKYFNSERDGKKLLNLELDATEQTDYSEQYPDKLNELKEQLRVFQQRQLYYYTMLPQEERDRRYPPKH